MRTVAIVLALAAVLAVLAGSGCIVVGCPKTLKQDGTTLGQELMDLKKAKDTGAIDEQEYQQLRQRLIDARKPAPAKSG